MSPETLAGTEKIGVKSSGKHRTGTGFPDDLAEVDDMVQFNNLEFVVKEVDGARITKLEIVKKEPVEEAQGQ